MTISFNNVDMLLADPEGVADRFVRSYSSWPHAEINSPPTATHSNQPIPRPNWPKRPPMGVNQLYFPTGASRWACGLFLTDQAGVDSLATVLTGKLIMDLSNETINVSVTPSGAVSPVEWNAGSRFCAYMHKLDPVPVSVTDDTLWIVPLVDVRYFWQGMSVRLENIGTWEELITELAEKLTEQSGTEDTATTFIARELGDAYNWLVTLADPELSIPDPCFFSQQPVNVPNAMDMVCWTLGLRFIPEDLTTGLTTDSTRFRLINYHNRGSFPGGGSSVDNGVYHKQRDAMLASATTRATAGGDSQTEDSADVPNEVQMQFVELPSGPAKEEYLSTQSLGLSTSGNHARRVWSPAVPTSDNHTELDTLAEVWTAGFAAWVRYKFRWTWPGGPTPRFSGYEDFILFSQVKSRAIGRYVAHVRVDSLPRTWGWELVPFQLPANSGRACGGGDGAIIAFQVTDIYRGFGLNCNAVEAVVTNVSSGSGVAEGDSIIVWDIDLGCNFALPPNLLIGLKGKASRMTNNVNPYTWVGPDTIPEGPTRWEVIRLCCSEEEWL